MSLLMLGQLFEYFKVTHPKITTVIILLGLLIIIRKFLRYSYAFYRVILRPKRNLKNRYGQKTWAFVTGSSEGTKHNNQGIGRAIALQFAKQGFNVIISARTQNKLQNVKDQIRQKYPNIEVKILAMDYKEAITMEYLSEHLQEVNLRISQILDLDISILVNNVGTDVLQFYEKLSPTKIVDLIKLNCFPGSLLMRLFIPRFEQRFKTGKKSAIVNVASIAGGNYNFSLGEVPIALHNVYSASKAFVRNLSVCLSYEHSNIDIMCLNPSQVSTPMTGNPGEDIFTITPQKCARGMINNMGYQRETNGYWSHQLQSYLCSLVPVSLFNWVFIRFLGPQFIKNREIDAQKKLNKPINPKHQNNSDYLTDLYDD